MSFSDFFKSTEADALKVIVKIQNGIEFADHEVMAAFSWLNAHAGDIASALNVVSQAVGALAGAGVAVPPTVLTAVRDANVAVAGLNAMVASQEKGTPEALIDGYVASKHAWKAADAAALALATSKPNA